MKNTNRCLVVTCGFFGDIVFASSLAEKLKNQFNNIDYLIGFPQIKRLLENNPFIRYVYVSNPPSTNPISTLNISNYSKIINLQPLHYITTPCEEYQQFANIENPTSDYKIYTQPEFDVVAKDVIADLRTKYNKPVIAVMSNWKPKTYIFTKEQYELGIDVPNLGYGGSHRDVQYIVDELQNHFTLYPVGVGDSNQYDTIFIDDVNQKSLLFEASILKYCDAFIGTDGGLATIAAGVNTKTIITGDFNLQLYGWNGVIKKIKDPKLGPEKYFPEFGHITLDPYLTDKEVVQQIINNIK
jgi:hypothetical protein